MTQEFKAAPWDKTTKLGTPLTLLLVAAVAIGVLVMGLILVKEECPGCFYSFIGLDAFLIIVMGLVPLYAPRGYALNKKGVVIKRTFSLLIPYEDIGAVEAVEKIKSGFRKLYGAAGFFGYIGTFTIKDDDGKYKISKVYTTRMNQLVRIRTKKTIYYLSPENPEIFIAALKSRLTR